MATPYSTPGYPRAPRATPSSVAPSSRAALRAPIHNPFDKFTQPEFDAWIGDITGALKRALGREELPPIATPVSQSEDSHPADISAYGDVDDSFAEIKARRAAKGKERAREEDFSDNDDVEESRSPDVVVISSDEEDEEEASHDESVAEDYDEDVGEGSEEDISDHDEDQLDPVYEISYDGERPGLVLLADEEEDEEAAGGEEVNWEDIDEAVVGAGTHGRGAPSSPPQVRQTFEFQDDDDEEEDVEDAGELMNTAFISSLLTVSQRS